MSSIKFIKPPKGVLLPNGDSDPIDFYHKPIVQDLYVGRIQAGLNLLDEHYDKIMEFGYGSGILFPTLDRICDELHGLDIDSQPEIIYKTIKNLNLKHRPILSQKDLLLEKYPSNHFDLIVAFSVFEHIKNPIDLLAELNRILKPEGKLLIGMPRVDTFMKQLFKLIGFNDIDAHHVARYQDLIDLSEKYFDLKKKQHFPKFVPESLGLYYNMLFQKK